MNINNNNIITDYNIIPNDIPKKLNNGLFIFRRDLRIIDNNGLNSLNEICNSIITIFIFTPEQVTNKNNFKSNNAIQFMIESLEDLSKSISNKGGVLQLFYGNNNEIIKKIIKDYNIDIVGFNMDCSPYAQERDKSIIELCRSMNVLTNINHDYYLNDLDSIKNGSNNTYLKFTPFYNNAVQKHVEKPKKYSKINFNNNLLKSKNIINYKITLDKAYDKFTILNKNKLVSGGRINGLLLLNNAVKTQKNYAITRNDLSKNTTLLSAHIKFGCISIREVYYSLKFSKEIIRQLYWRDFYANILFSHPNMLKNSLKSNYDKIKWKNNKNWFKKWCNGETGFPIVDAGMRQLNETGYMHNRVRLIVSSFLVKNLLINWRYGEKYFAQNLTDYDPASNNGNWQWTAGSGVDSQPYFRVINPWLQTETLDPQCIYIKRWIIELREIPIKDILNWEIKCKDYKDINYPEPIINYKESKEKGLELYKYYLYS